MLKENFCLLFDIILNFCQKREQKNKNNEKQKIKRIFPSKCKPKKRWNLYLKKRLSNKIYLI